MPETPTIPRDSAQGHSPFVSFSASHACLAHHRCCCGPSRCPKWWIPCASLPSGNCVQAHTWQTQVYTMVHDACARWQCPAIPPVLRHWFSTWTGLSQGVRLSRLGCPGSGTCKETTGDTRDAGPRATLRTSDPTRPGQPLSGRSSASSLAVPDALSRGCPLLPPGLLPPDSPSSFLLPASAPLMRGSRPAA